MNRIAAALSQRQREELAQKPIWRLEMMGKVSRHHWERLSDQRRSDYITSNFGSRHRQIHHWTAGHRIRCYSAFLNTILEPEDARDYGDTITIYFYEPAHLNWTCDCRDICSDRLSGNTSPCEVTRCRYRQIGVKPKPVLQYDLTGTARKPVETDDDRLKRLAREVPSAFWLQPGFFESLPTNPSKDFSRINICSPETDRASLLSMNSRTSRPTRGLPSILRRIHSALVG